MSPLVDNYQCLACGALTAMDSHATVPDDIPNVTTSPSGHPVKELSETALVVLAPAGPESPPEADSEPYELDEIEPDGLMGPEDSEPVKIGRAHV